MTSKLAFVAALANVALLATLGVAAAQTSSSSATSSPATSSPAPSIVPTGAVSVPSSAAEPACESDRLPVFLRPPGAPEPLTQMRAIQVAVPRPPALRLAVAATTYDRELGLMCLTALRARTGMIFVFQRGGEQEFWMKRTLVPLDMIFVGSDGVVTAVAANVPRATLDTPDDAVARRSGYARFVIELAAGEAARAGIARGVRLVLPALSTSE